MQELRKFLAFVAIAGAAVVALWVLWPRPLPRQVPSLPAPSPPLLRAIVDGGVAPRTIVGRVLDVAGKPVAGARVDVVAQPRANEVEASGELGILHGTVPFPPAEPLFAGPAAVSDGDGAFRLSVPPGRLWLSASHPQFSRKTVEAAGDRVELVLEPLPAAAAAPPSPPVEPGNQRLAGAVVDERGFPVAGARVEAAGRSALSDDSGRFELAALPGGPYQVRASHADFAPTDVTVAAGDEARLQLMPGGGIEGRLDDSRGGRLPESAALELSVDGRAQSLPLHDGRFEVTGIRAGRVTLSARAPGYVPLHHTLEVPAGDRPRDLTVRDLRLVIERAGVIAGSVRDDDGAPVSGAQVSVGAANCRSDGRGEFRLETVAPGRAHVLAAGGGRRATEEVEVRADEESRVDLTLR